MGNAIKCSGCGSVEVLCPESPSPAPRCPDCGKPRKARSPIGVGACGHVRCDCSDGAFYGREEVSDADPGL